MEQGEAEAFVAALAAERPRLKRGRLRLLHECWLSVPSRLVFATACTLPRLELKAWTTLASLALLTRRDAEAFEEAHEIGDPQPELESWLRNRAYINRPGIVEKV